MQGKQRVKRPGSINKKMLVVDCRMLLCRRRAVQGSSRILLHAGHGHSHPIPPSARALRHSELPRKAQGCHRRHLQVQMGNHEHAPGCHIHSGCSPSSHTSRTTRQPMAVIHTSFLGPVLLLLTSRKRHADLERPTQIYCRKNFHFLA